MPRLGRWFFNAAVVTYVLLCLATVTLWVRSYGVWDQFIVRPNFRPLYIPYLWRLSIGNGMCMICWDPVVGPDHKTPPSWGQWRHRTFTPSKRPSMLTDRRGFFYFYVIQAPVPFGADLHIPFRTLSFPLGIPLAVWLCRSWRRRRRIPAGCCSKCGYDLRATPDRCPECGAVPAKANLS